MPSSFSPTTGWAPSKLVGVVEDVQEQVRVGEFGPQDLDGDVAIVLEIRRESPGSTTIDVRPPIIP